MVEDFFQRPIGAKRSIDCFMHFSGGGLSFSWHDHAFLVAGLTDKRTEASLKEFQDRWKVDQVTFVVSALRAGALPPSPFGLTAEGRVDLRGLVVEQPLILSGVSANRVDLSYSKAAKLLFMRCRLEDWVFDHARLVLLSNGGRISHSTFDESKLSTSSSGGAAEFNDCSFQRCDLTGCNFEESAFNACDFEEALLDNIEFDGSSITASRFRGEITRSFFRGKITGCDFSDAAFLDCAFYGAEFHDCQLSRHALLFDDWPPAFKAIQEQALSKPLSQPARKSIDKWCRVWAKVNGLMKQELIDERNLKNLEGEEIGDELFRFLKEIQERVSRQTPVH